MSSKSGRMILQLRAFVQDAARHINFHSQVSKISVWLHLQERPGRLLPAEEVIDSGFKAADCRNSPGHERGEDDHDAAHRRHSHRRADVVRGGARKQCSDWHEAAIEHV
jgi:hypothetical protein